jgi:hypothetical protein
MLVAIVLAVATVNCTSSFRETHFFKSQSQPGGIPNFFRLTVKGETWFSSSRYISGYFDEDIVNQYFNEIGQPAKGQLIPVGQSKEIKSVNGKGNESPQISSKPPEGLKSPALVLLLSSNSDDIANQIGALAQSQEFTSSLARLMAAPRFEAADEAERLLRNDQTLGHALVTLGDQLVTGLPDKASASEVKTNMLQFVNQLGADLGAAGPFQKLEDAATWLDEHRGRLRKETRP